MKGKRLVPQQAVPTLNQVIIAAIIGLPLAYFGYIVSPLFTHSTSGMIMVVFIFWLSSFIIMSSFLAKKPPTYIEEEYDSCTGKAVEAVTIKGTSESSDFKYCKKCGSKIDADSLFCVKCGAAQGTLEDKENDIKAPPVQEVKVDNPPLPTSQNNPTNTKIVKSEKPTLFYKKIFLGVALLVVLILALWAPKTAVQQEPIIPDIKPLSVSQVKTAFTDMGLNFGVSRQEGQYRSRRGQLIKDDGTQLDYRITYSDVDGFLSYAVLTVWLNGDNSAENVNLSYITNLIKKAYPNFKDPELFVKNSVKTVLAGKTDSERESRINYDNANLAFIYIVDAGGVENDNAILFGIEQKP